MVKGTKKGDLRLLVIEPYYGGSHKNFLDGLCPGLPFDIDLMTLPAHKWKARMRLSAPYFADRLRSTGAAYDRILCSTFIDVASFRGLAPEWVRRVPTMTYFHENQFEYPVRIEEERDLHFALTNMTTAMASDRAAFNSSFNLETFIRGIEGMGKAHYDMGLEEAVVSIREKSCVIPPAIDFAGIDGTREKRGRGRPVVLWNHRWEHDKGPEEFFRVLFRLDSEGLDFDVIILGESYMEEPQVFDEARKRLAGRILHMGYVKDRNEYADLLRTGTIVVSTARHEFFGIAVVESVRAGCVPLLPRKLSYPELFPSKYLYDEGELLTRLRNLIILGKGLSDTEARELTDPFSIETLSGTFEDWIRG